ncbi:MAG TPA: flagellar biosynthetic protein FliR [Candidatus Ozemobacteraceae bacterium]|nr:flagellar biosynthetic protein FliR [Candidatus Ozemobacteraceae bacterium]
MTEAFFLRAVGTFLISLVRISGALINLPAFGEGVVLNRVKAGIAALMSLLLLPHLMRTQPLPSLGILDYGVMALKELALGLTLGYIVLIIIDTLKFAGELIGMQIGFSFVQVVDPESSRGQAIMAEFFQILGVLTFLLMDGHLIFLGAFMQSFDLVPLAGMVFNSSMATELARLTAGVFLIGLQLSMPIIGIILISDAALGIIARTVPRMNVFQVGFALKISLGLWVITMILPFISDKVHRLFDQGYQTIGLFMRLMSGA